MADIAISYSLQFAERLGLAERFKPNCLRYLDEMLEGPKLRRSDPAEHAVAISARSGQLLDSPDSSRDKTPPWNSPTRP